VPRSEDKILIEKQNWLKTNCERQTYDHFL